MSVNKIGLIIFSETGLSIESCEISGLNETGRNLNRCIGTWYWWSKSPDILNLRKCFL